MPLSSSNTCSPRLQDSRNLIFDLPQTLSKHCYPSQQAKMNLLFVLASVIFALLSWTLISGISNYNAARKIGFPIIISPVSPMNPFWILTYRIFPRYSYYGIYRLVLARGRDAPIWAGHSRTSMLCTINLAKSSSLLRPAAMKSRWPTIRLFIWSCLDGRNSSSQLSYMVGRPEIA